MKHPARLSNPNSPEVIISNLSYGIESNNRLTDLQLGSCQNLTNAFITESNSIQSITGYSSYTRMNGYKNISMPLCIGNISDGYNSSTYTYTVSSKDGKAYLCVSQLNGEMKELSVFPDEYVITVFYRMLVINKQILIYNGYNYPILWDIDSAKFIQWTPLDNPTDKPTITTNIPGATQYESHTVHFSVSFYSSVGHTVATPKGQVIISKDPSVSGDDEYIDITIPTPPPNAVSWNVYMGVDEGERGILYALNKDPIPIDTKTFRYTRDTELLFDLIAPTDNTTNPIVFNFANVINSRVWITQISKWNGEQYPYTIAWSGTGKDCFDFSSSVGGGFIDIELGTPNFPQCINMFRKNNGDTGIVLLTGGASSAGKRFVLEPQAIQYSQGTSGTVEGFAPDEQLSALGTVAGWSATAVDTFLAFISTSGIISTQTNQNSFNILSNNNIGLKIQKIVENIPQSQYKKIQTINYGTRIFWRLFNIDNTPFILCFDYIKQSFSIIDVPLDAMFIDQSIDNRLKLGVSVNGELHYIDISNSPEIELETTIELNYAKLNNARTRTTYGRLIESTVLFERLEPGLIDFSFNGVNKDDIQKTSLQTENTGFSENDYYTFYRAHVKLYRDKIISDKVKLSIKSKGVSYCIDEIHYNFDPAYGDWIKNKFQRAHGALENIEEHKYFVLQSEDEFNKHKTQWVDTALWNDEYKWND